MRGEKTTSKRTVKRRVEIMTEKPPIIPTPEHDNLKELSIEQLAEEFIALRLYCGKLQMWCQDFVNSISLNEAVSRALVEIRNFSQIAEMRSQATKDMLKEVKKELEALQDRVYTLERKLV